LVPFTAFLSNQEQAFRIFKFTAMVTSQFQGFIVPATIELSSTQERLAYAIRPAALCSFLEQRRSAAQGLDYSLGNLPQLSRPNRNIPVCAANLSAANSKVVGSLVLPNESMKRFPPNAFEFILSTPSFS
jgi:hypothetical protein